MSRPIKSTCSVCGAHVDISQRIYRRLVLCSQPCFEVWLHQRDNDKDLSSAEIERQFQAARKAARATLSLSTEDILRQRC